MLSRLGRFIRGRLIRDRRTETEQEGDAERPTTVETQPGEGDVFAQEVMRRVRPPAVSRVPSRPSLAVSAGRPLVQAALPRVRHDVPSGELPLARPARPSAAPVGEAEADEAPVSDTRFYEGSTGDARWDALWAMRGTQRTAGEATPPGIERPSEMLPPDRPAPRRSPPASPGRSAQRTPSPPTRSVGPASEGTPRGPERAVQRTPGEPEAELPAREQEDSERQVAGEEIPASHVWPSQDASRTPSPEQHGRTPGRVQRSSEGPRPEVPPPAASTASPAPGQERLRLEGTTAPGPPRAERRIVPRSSLEELPTRREAPPPPERPDVASEPQLSLDGEPAPGREPPPPSPGVTPPSADTPAQREPSGPEASEATPADEIPSAENEAPAAAHEDRAPPVGRAAAADETRRGARRTPSAPPPVQPSPVQRAPAGDADRPVGPPIGTEPPRGRGAVVEPEVASQQARQAPPTLERAEGGSPAAAQPPADRTDTGRSPDEGELPVGRPSSGDQLLEQLEPPHSEGGPATVSEPPASAGRAERGNLAERPPATARGEPVRGPAPVGASGRPVQAQPEAPVAGGEPVEPGADQRPASLRLDVEGRTGDESAPTGPAIQRPPAQEPGSPEPGISSRPEPAGSRRERPEPGRPTSRPVEPTAEVPAVRAAAAPAQREADTECAVEGEPDRRALLRQAMQPRIVPAVVQATRADDTQATAAAGTASQETGAAKPAEGEEPDVESLARDVYRILRRRLLVERERDLGAR